MTAVEMRRIADIAAASMRLVPERPKRPEPVACTICWDYGRMFEIIGGQEWPIRCPKCGSAA